MVGAIEFPLLFTIPEAFRQIDTYEKAYLFGFLLADGCVRVARPGSPGCRVVFRILAEDCKVCQSLTRRGYVLASRSPQKLTGLEIGWAVEELAKGRTLKAVAEELGVSGTLVKLRKKEWEAKRLASDAGQS